MDTLDEFLLRLLRAGRVHFRGEPAKEEGAAGAALHILGRAFEDYRLEVAGPPIAFDPAVALAASELVRQACWALVSRAARPDELARRLSMPHAPATAAHHLSADLLLRYLPQVHRRAKGIDPVDPLVGLLERDFRQWPLSGVLSGLEEGPPSPPDLAGHPGLMLLYAERLAEHEPPGWRPAPGALGYVELVLAERGRARSPLLVAEGGGDGDG